MTSVKLEHCPNDFVHRTWIGKVSVGKFWAERGSVDFHWNPGADVTIKVALATINGRSHSDLE